jgi:DNA-binding MarR family transcriptional regulator
MKIDGTVSRISRIRDYANRIIIRELKEMGYTEIAPSHGDIISVLIHRGEMTKTELANAINRDRSTVTVLLKKLEKLDFIATRVNEADSRSAIVYLTEKGIGMKKAFIEISEKLYEIQYKNMNEDQINALKSGLEQLYRNFKTEVDDA